MKLKKIKYIGIVFTLLSFYYIIYNITKIDFDFSSIHLNLKNSFTLILSILACAFSVYLFGFAWMLILNNINAPKVASFKLIKIYVKTNIGKYLPGNVMHFAARNIFGNRYGISHVNLGISSILEILFILVTLLIFLISFESSSFIKIIKNTNIKWAHYVAFIVIAVLIILWVILFKRDYLQKKIRLLSIKNILIAFLSTFPVYCFIFMIFGYILFLLIGQTSSTNLVLGETIHITLYYALAWIAGLVVIGAPGGIGVRESVLLLLLSPIYDKQSILIAIILHRLVYIVGEFLAFGVSIMGTSINYFLSKNKYK